ncbi:hypothetical protein EGH24_02465 [Halonotius terrestris]|uniref:DUF7999 domain-containing protein n=1 Tax=Halonotius terrestris TaxID=2487750 RepID=A0A8J8PE71_9EURY|nr:hypothetical protein [Halonotius terrestris]TQQ83670.1 hypothetical protein EGH24_02465 [Halonotius terrestris]
MKQHINGPREFRVLREMNSNNAINLLCPSADRVFQIVDYEDHNLKTELASLESGKLIELDLDRIASRANVWRANWP